MDFRCPSCQKDLTVPDEYAGQLMKCPLCQNTFQAPALPPPVAPTPSPGPGTYSVEAPPTVPAAPPPGEAVSTRRVDTPPAPPPPPGDYTHTSTIWVSPRVVPWITPAALLLIFVLTFFSWAHGVPAGKEAKETPDHSAWGWGFSEANILTAFYLILFLIMLIVSIAITVLRLIPNALKLPPGLQQVWPWRSALVGLLAAVTFFFLVLQVFVGFSVKGDGVLTYIETTAWTGLVVILHFTALAGALLDFWLEIRGPSRPVPRIDISW
jgi:hypothetical protein